MSKTKKKLILASIGICLLGGAVLAVEPHYHYLYSVWDLEEKIEGFERDIRSLKRKVRNLESRLDSLE